MLDTIVRPDQGPQTDPVGPPVTLPGPEPTILVPVLRGGAVPRPIGAYVVGRGTVHYRPAFDVREILAAATVVAAVTAVAVSRRGRPAVGSVHMGPGGWVSIKGVPAPALRPSGRPWWARLLRARRLVVERA
ncbi:hypothetical protein [Phytohabitans houttuyneae]|jgi:hypothetical protein|uniref:Uncharacterized protein n=1 Tax=Phytohabitans houttuyneae TaxID=1076126 RepID=A0A6V8KHX9_9ACTN|nr:hypothetical protein [Phytohabitans houttuyneae]GFJ81709.1 hypothetical protein Phou_058890 [Phytohabitans houttuyneae]